MRNRISRVEKSILDRLVEKNYEAMVVGGAVRDYLIGREFNDIDIATNAPYDKLIDIMSDLGEVKLVGKQFGVLLVNGVEVATYRMEECKDNKVLSMTRAKDAYTDSLRRDFTINSFYYDYSINKTWDFHNASLDIRNKVIKTVGSPYDRFKEDYSRILRAAYLSSALDFNIYFITGKAMQELNYCLEKVPNALVGKIVKKSISSGSFHKFLAALDEYDLLSYIFPEMYHTVGLEQNPRYHQYDVWEHTLKVVEEAEKMHKGDVAFVMGAFLHDVAKGLEGIRKPNKEGEPSDIGHEEAGVSIAASVCNRLELGKSVVDEVSKYVRWHGARMNTKEKSIKKFLFKFKEEYKNIDALKNGFNKLLDFMICDAKGFEPSFGSLMLETTEFIRKLSLNVFKKQIFYTRQFDFDAGLIAKHKNVDPSEIKEVIEFFIHNNIKEEEKVLKILDKKDLQSNIK